MKGYFLSIAALVMMASPVCASAAASGDVCGGVSGAYGPEGTGAIVVNSDSKSVSVWVTDGRPLAYGTCEGNKLVVNFSDDHTINGVYDKASRTVKWDNGTSWTKTMK